MENRAKIFNLISAITVFIAIPALWYVIGDFPQRTFLKETISIVTLLAFFIMMLMFYLSRINRNVLMPFKMGKVLKWHKALGYTFVGILLIHPLLVVVPRYFEAGITPVDAFMEILSNFDKQGLLFGLIAWGLILIIGLTSFFRNSLPMTYKTWRVVHGILCVGFLSMASFHIIQTGRHMNNAFICLIILLAGLGIAMLTKKYITDLISEKA